MTRSTRCGPGHDDSSSTRTALATQLSTEDRVAPLDGVGGPASVGDTALGSEEPLSGGHGVHAAGLDGALVGLTLGVVRAEVGHGSYLSFGSVV